MRRRHRRRTETNDKETREERNFLKNLRKPTRNRPSSWDHQRIRRRAPGHFLCDLISPAAVPIDVLKDPRSHPPPPLTPNPRPQLCSVSAPQNLVLTVCIWGYNCSVGSGASTFRRDVPWPWFSKEPLQVGGTIVGRSTFEFPWPTASAAKKKECDSVRRLRWCGSVSWNLDRWTCFSWSQIFKVWTLSRHGCPRSSHVLNFAEELLLSSDLPPSLLTLVGISGRILCFKL